MTEASTPAVLRPGKLTADMVPLLKAGSSVLRRTDGLCLWLFKSAEEDGWMRLVFGSSETALSFRYLTYIGESDADGRITAPDGGWTENPVPGLAVEATTRAGTCTTGRPSETLYWPHEGIESDITAFRLSDQSLSPEGSSAARIPTEGVTASGDDLLHKTIKRLKQHVAAIQKAKRAVGEGRGEGLHGGHPIIACINDLPEIVRHLEAAEFGIEAAFEEYENGPIPALTVDALAQEIRRVDGNHDLGAGALAEALLPFIEAARQGPARCEPSGNAQSSVYGSQAIHSASTTNIRVVPEPSGEVELVASDCRLMSRQPEVQEIARQAMEPQQ